MLRGSHLCSVYRISPAWIQNQTLRHSLEPRGFGDMCTVRFDMHSVACVLFFDVDRVSVTYVLFFDTASVTYVRLSYDTASVTYLRFSSDTESRATR